MYCNRSFGLGAARVAEPILASLKHQLKLVDLSDFVAGRPEVEALDVMDLFSNALQGSNLSSLNLSDNALGEKGVRAFGTLLKSLSSLEELYLMNDGISKEAAQAVSELIPSTEKLKVHHFHNYSLEADSAIAPCVAAKLDLNKLNLSENELKDEGRDGAVALADVVMKKEGFMLLNIDGDIISEEGIEEVREIFKKKPELLGDLDENDPDEEDEEDDELESKLKNLEVNEDD
ncbi:hypothetical protein F2Q68_00007525 [Brassica cretica]|uniref:WPP domain-containing protein n=1 Tax=Brassica cretica TaxID=69181 RepID=A0A8S9L0W1_BRACR|nr:hypothetical protein F2Q68_00007525 [Brassica cretica]